MKMPTGYPHSHDKSNLNPKLTCTKTHTSGSNKFFLETVKPSKE